MLFLLACRSRNHVTWLPVLQQFSAIILAGYTAAIQLTTVIAISCKLAYAGVVWMGDETLQGYYPLQAVGVDWNVDEDVDVVMMGPRR